MSGPTQESRGFESAPGEPFFIENKIKQFKAETAKADSAIGEIIPRSIQTQGNA